MRKAALFSAKPDSTQNKVAVPVIEIALVICCVLIAEWAVLPLFGKGNVVGIVPVVLAFTIMLHSHWIHRETPRELGFRFDNFWRCLLRIVPVMAMATGFLAIVGWLCGSLRLFYTRPNWEMLSVLAGLSAWGLVQQYALQAFINRRAQAIWGSGAVSILFVASIFALLHLPNLWLSVATFFGGLLWAWAYQRTPNLFALGLSHAVMTIVLVTTVPYSSLHGMRVGYGYFLLGQ